MGKNLFRKIDQLGEKVTLKWGRKEHFKTCVGGVVAIPIAIVAVYQLSKTVDSTNVETTFTEQYSETFPRYEPIEAGLFPALTILGGASGRIISAEKISSYITVEFLVVELVTTIAPNTITENTLRRILFKPCSQVEDENKEKLYYQQNSTKEYVQNLAICPDFGGNYSDFYVEGSLVNSSKVEIWLMIYPCSLPDSEECAPAEEVTGTDIVILLPKINFDPENYSNPFLIVPDSGFRVSIQPSTQKQYWTEISSTKIMDDQFDFVEKMERVGFQEMGELSYNALDRVSRGGSSLTSCSGKEDLLEECQPYALVGVTSSGSSKTIVRRYDKLIKSLGDIGGFSELVLSAAAVLVILLVKGKLTRFLIKNLLKTSGEEISEAVGIPKDDNTEHKPHRYQMEERSDRTTPTERTQLYGQSGRVEDELREGLTQKKVEKCLQEVIEDSQDGTRLFKSMNLVSLIQDSVMSENMTKLLPLVLLENVRRRKEAQKLQTRRKGGVVNNSKKNQKKDENGDLSYQQAYQNLVADLPQSELEAKIRQHILDSIPPEFALLLASNENPEAYTEKKVLGEDITGKGATN